MRKINFNIKNVLRTIIKNALPFLINLIFILIFGSIFGSENMLLAVAIGVGLTMLPVCDLKIKPLAASLIIFILYVGSAIIGQSALISPFIAFPLNFLFVILIVMLIDEPSQMKPSISFLLSFVFCQSTVVPWHAFPQRICCVVTGAVIVIITCLLFWHFKGYGKSGRGIKEQIILCNKNHRYMFRMAFGISIAMFIGSFFRIEKPLWISIVVMSLTQVHWQDTLTRIKHRFIGNLLGIIVFFMLFQLIIPKEYAFYFIILLGYLGSFTNQYKYKQMINAVSAINASLVLLDTKTAIIERLGLLIIGVLIVIIIYIVAEIIKKEKDLLKERQKNIIESK